MPQEITILLDLKTAEALQKMTQFVENASEGLKRLAEYATEAFLSFEGLKKLEEGVSEAIKLEESIGRLGQKTGLAVPTIVAMREEAEKLGIPFDRLSFGLTQFSQKIYEAATDGGKAAEMFQHLGVSLINADGTLRGTDAILQALLERLRELPDGPQKAAAAMEMFGRAGKDLIPILNEAAEAVSRGVEGPITAESVAQAMDFEQKLRQVNEAVEMLWVEVANKLLPTLQDMANRLLEFSRNADANRESVMALAGVIKGLITVVLPLGLAFYDLGQMIGVAVYYDVQNIIVAFNTMKSVLVDVKTFVVDLWNSLLDLSKTFSVVAQAFALAETGQFAAAKDVLSSHFKTLVADAKQAGHDVAHGFADGFAGFAQIWSNDKEFANTLLGDWKSQWGQMSKFLHDMWTDTATSPTHAAAGGGSPFVPVSSMSLANMNEMNRLAAELYKQEAKLIEQDQLLTNVQKYNELLPLMQRQIDLVLQEYDAEKKIYDNPNTSDKDRIAALKEMVRLQSELSDLELKRRNAAPDTFFTAMQRNAVQLANTWGNLSVDLANGAFATITKGIQGMAQALTAVIMGTESAGQAFEQFAMQMLTSFIEMILESILYAEVAIPILTALGVLSGGTTTATGSAVTIASMATAMGAVNGMVAAREFGGGVTAGVPYIVGEKRAELFVPDQSGFILPSVPAPAYGGGAGGGTNVENHMVFAFHGSEAAAKKWVQSKEGKAFLVDIHKKSVRQVSRNA